MPPIWEEAPTEALYTKNCVVGNLLDVIKCAKFQNETFRGYYFTGGRILIFEWVLQQYSTTALPAISLRETSLCKYSAPT